MSLPLQITFRHIEPSPALEARIRRKSAELEQVFDRITACHVVVECRHRHQHQGKLFEVRIDLSVPGSQLVAGRRHSFDHAHQDAYIAARDAFDAAKRRLADHVRTIRDGAKQAAATSQIELGEPPEMG